MSAAVHYRAPGLDALHMHMSTCLTYIIVQTVCPCSPSSKPVTIFHATRRRLGRSKIPRKLAVFVVVDVTNAHTLEVPITLEFSKGPSDGLGIPFPKLEPPTAWMELGAGHR